MSSISASEESATDVSGRGASQGKKAPHAGTWSARLTDGTTTDKPVKYKFPPTITLKKPFIERQADKVSRMGQVVVNAVKGVGKRRLVREKTVDRELVGYLRYTFAFQPRNVATLRSMTTKARVFLNDYDLTSFDYDELHEMVVGAVAAAMLASEAELRVIKDIGDSEAKAMRKLNEFVTDGVVRKTGIFGNIKTRSVLSAKP